MKVLWITNIPSPYRVDFFNVFGKSCNLTVVFEKGASDERDSTWQNYSFSNFQGIILAGKSIKTDAAICPSIIKILKQEKFDHIVLTNISSPTGIMAVMYMQMHQIAYWIEGDGGFINVDKGMKNRLKLLLKSHIFKGAKGCFSTGVSHDNYYVYCGVDRNKIYRYPFSSISETVYENALCTCDVESTIQESDEINQRIRVRQVAKEKLGISNDTKVVLFVGQMIHRKGIDVLLMCAEQICMKHGDVLFVLVGGNCPKELIDQKERLGNNVIFVPFVIPDELKSYYRAADVFCLPTREDIWGLVINEAMTYELPIITTDRCGAGVELVKDGINGFIVPSDDIGMMIKRLESIIMNGNSMGLESRKIISEYTIENMAASHITVLESEIV